MVIARGDEIGAWRNVCEMLPCVAFQKRLDIKVGSDISPAIAHAKAVPAIFNNQGVQTKTGKQMKSLSRVVGRVVLRSSRSVQWKWKSAHSNVPEPRQDALVD